jgi:hypothetical protein
MGRISTPRVDYVNEQQTRRLTQCHRNPKELRQRGLTLTALHTGHFFAAGQSHRHCQALWRQASTLAKPPDHPAERNG